MTTPPLPPHPPAEDVSAYLLGGLSDPEADAVAAHLADCADCRAEADRMRGTVAALDDVPPEFFLDGPPDDGDLLLQRILREVRSESPAAASIPAPAPARTGTRTPRRWLLPAVAAAAVLVAGGIAVGRYTAPDHTPAVTAPVTVPGTLRASTTDPATGAAIDLTVVPAAGWVRLTAKVTGIPEGQRCEVVVVGKDGEQRVAGSWLVSAVGAASGTDLSGFALVDVADVSSVQVRNLDGRVFVTAQPA